MAQGRMEHRWSFVAVEGFIGDWAAYGANKLTDEGGVSIACNGDKLSYSVAKAVFPHWGEELTWRR